jgi:hypothetical protein
MRLSALSAVLAGSCATGNMGGAAPYRQPTTAAAATAAEEPYRPYGPGAYGRGPYGYGPGMMGRMGPGMMTGPAYYQQTPQTEQTTQPPSSGAQLVAEYCSQCHALPSATQHTPTQWPAVVSRMQGYIQASSAQIVRPSSSQIATMVHYLERHAALDQMAKR